MTRLPASSAEPGPIHQRRQESSTSVLPMHTSSGSGSSGEERGTTELLVGRIGSARASSGRHHRRRQGSGLMSRVRNNWKLLLVGALAVVLVLALVGSNRIHQQQQHEHAGGNAGRLSTHPVLKAPGPETTALDDEAAGAQPRYSVWSHSYRLFHSLRQRWRTRESPPAQGVSVAQDTGRDDGGPTARRCALPKPHAASGEEAEALHNQAFFLGGQAFDRVPPPPMASLRPRGVVISATGTVERLAVGAYITAFLVRRVFNSTLPIEIYHVSDREAFAPELKQQLEALGDVRVIDLVTALEERFGDVLAAEATEASERVREEQQQQQQQMPHHATPVVAGGGGPDGPPMQVRQQQPDSHLVYLKPSIEQLASYAAKAYAMLVCSFQEVLLFDAGAVPFQDPDAFFALDDFQQTGFLVFRDYVPWTDHKWDWMAEEFCIDTAAIRNYYAGTEGDSSCVMMDKRRHWDALLVAAILNGPLQHTTYQRLNGDKDTWVMAVLYASGGRPLPPLNTVPGFLFVDYEGNFVARKVHGQLQLLKIDNEQPEERAVDKQQQQQQQQQQQPQQQQAEEERGGLLVPLYFNNQLFNFTQWQWNKGWTYVGSYEDFGAIYRPPHSLSPDCHPVRVEHLDPLSPVMEKAFDGVVAALKTIGSKQCGCRDDWPSACVTFIY